MGWVPGKQEKTDILPVYGERDAEEREKIRKIIYTLDLFFISLHIYKKGLKNCQAIQKRLRESESE